MPEDNHALSGELLARIRTLALEQVRLMDDLEDALAANDVPRIVDLAWALVGVEKQVGAAKEEGPVQ